MKAKKYLEELNTKTVAELKTDLDTAKRQLFDLRLKNATNQLTDTSKIRDARKNIARIQTVITLKERV